VRTKVNLRRLRLGFPGSALAVDSALAERDLKQALVTPRVVPAVGNKPVLGVILDSPSDDLHSVSSERRSRSVLVNSGLVAGEIRVDGESSSDRSLFHEVLLDVVGAAETVCLSRCRALVACVDDVSVGWAGLLACRADLFDVFTWLQCGGVDVVRALRHGVVVAELVISVVASSHNTSAFEPSPGRHDLTAVTAHGQAAQETTAASGIGNRQERGEVAFCGDALSVIESLSGSMSPARSTVGLIADVADH